MAQSVERRLGKAEVTGSIPVSSSVEEVRISVKFSLFFCEIGKCCYAEWKGRGIWQKHLFF